MLGSSVQLIMSSLYSVSRGLLQGFKGFMSTILYTKEKYIKNKFN
jgi:hypothetical protein